MMSSDAGGMAARREALADEKKKNCRKEREERGSWHFNCFSMHSGQWTERLGLRLCRPPFTGTWAATEKCAL